MFFYLNLFEKCITQKYFVDNGLVLLFKVFDLFISINRNFDAFLLAFEPHDFISQTYEVFFDFWNFLFS